MEIRPILSAMLRNKVGALLVGLQIALTLAVVANAVFIINQRNEKIARPSGMDSENILFVQSYGFGPTYDQKETVRLDLDTIKAIPGVIAASAINAMPMSGGGSSTGYRRTTEETRADDVVANYYDIDENGLEALGVKLIAGRNFTQEEIQYSNILGSDFVPSVIITRDLGRALFGDESPLGRRVYDGIGQSAVIVGVVEHMMGSWVDSPTPTNVSFHPRIPSGPVARYVVRAEPGSRDQVLAEVERKLSESRLQRAITWVRPHEYFTDRSYRADSRMIIILSVIVGLMVTITALGIVGLASFYVNVRTKQIGTRRAVGARRIDIIRYFMLENWLLTTGGVVAGAVLAFAFSHWLTTAYALPRLQPMYVVSGIILLWILGQLAVFVPARRAAAIPPAIATKTV